MMGNFHWILEQGGVVEKEVPKLHECCMSDEQILKLCSISIKVGEGCWWKEKKNKLNSWFLYQNHTFNDHN